MTVVTGTFEEVFDLMFGPQQHDAHVKARGREMWLRRFEVGREARAAAVQAEVDRINAEYRAKHPPKFLEAAE